MLIHCRVILEYQTKNILWTQGFNIDAYCVYIYSWGSLLFKSSICKQARTIKFQRDIMLIVEENNKYNFLSILCGTRQF